jgi:hypothetical protein
MTKLPQGAKDFDELLKAKGITDSFNILSKTEVKYQSELKELRAMR